MINRFKYIAVFGLAFALTSCTDSGTENENSNQEKTEMNDQATSDAMLNLGIKLKDDKPWTANPEVAKGVDKMNQIIKEYDEREPSQETYRELSGRLMEQFDYMLSSAKMEGDARVQLHNYMKPMKQYFEELNSDNLNVAQNAVKKFKVHLSVFPKYFKW